MNAAGRLLAAALVAAGLSSCVDDRSSAPPERASRSERVPATAAIEPSQAQRLKGIMTPLIAQMNKPLATNQVKVTLWADRHVNAANAGGGDFYVTTGLLQRANDDQLRAILAHEIAHADLGHVAKAQTLAVGVGIGTLILDQILPGVSSVAPIAGDLVLKAHSRSEENEADAHAVTIMRRAGHDGRTLMADALEWIQHTEGDSGGGFFASHPATADRIEAIRALK